MINLINDDCLNYFNNNQNKLKYDLAICDPPYFKVVNEKWDYLWRTEDDYYNWSMKWISGLYETLRFGGSFYLFGYFRNLVYLIPQIEALGFELRQQIILNKGLRAISGRATKNYKLYPNVTETLLFFIKDNKKYIKEILLNKQKELNIKSKEINEYLGVKSNGGGMWSIYTGNNVSKQFPTEEIFNKLKILFNLSLDYNKISQTFNPILGLTDVWNDINFYEDKRWHPTQKPKKLIERLILTSSHINDWIIDPFAGSGITGLVSNELNRNALLIENNNEYFNLINDKLNLK